MNKIQNFILLLVCIISTGYAQQNVFYYSNNKRIELLVDTNTIVVKTKTIDLKGNQYQNLQIIDEDKHHVLRLNTSKEKLKSKLRILIKFLMLQMQYMKVDW